MKNSICFFLPTKLQKQTKSTIFDRNRFRMVQNVIENENIDSKNLLLPFEFSLGLCCYQIMNRTGQKMGIHEFLIGIDSEWLKKYLKTKILISKITFEKSMKI